MTKPNRSFSLLLTISLSACSVPLTASLPKQSLESRDTVEIRLQAKTNPEQGVNKITPSIMEKAKFVIEQRINSLGLSGVSVFVSANNQLVIQIPNLKDLTQAKRVIGTTAQLDFRKQKKGTENELRARMQIYQAATIERETLKTSNDKKAIDDNEAEYRKSVEALKGIFERTGLTGNMVKDAGVSQMGNGSNAWQIALAFDDRGGDLFANITGELGGTGRALGFFLDDKLISSPSVGLEFQGKGITGGRAVITGNFTLETSNELASQIRSGALPVPFEIVEIIDCRKSQIQKSDRCK